MALRVLLADESPTIKKVVELSLQDFGVEIRPVTVGIDVTQVATQFQPDIILVDILLQKRNGYDVCIEIKNHQDLKKIPVILMWSGFMDLDEEKLKQAQPNAKLEKPFDANTLREAIRNLVPKLQSQSIGSHLEFPKVEEEKETPKTEPEAPKKEEPSIQVQPLQNDDGLLTLPEDLPSASTPTEEIDLGNASDWEMKPLSKSTPAAETPENLDLGGAAPPVPTESYMIDATHVGPKDFNPEGLDLDPPEEGSLSIPDGLSPLLKEENEDSTPSAPAIEISDGTLTAQEQIPELTLKIPMDAEPAEVSAEPEAKSEITEKIIPEVTGDTPSDDNQEWETKDLSQFKIELQPEQSELTSSEYIIADENIDNYDFLTTPENSSISPAPDRSQVAPKAPAEATSPPIPSVSENQITEVSHQVAEALLEKISIKTIEGIIEGQAKAVIESIVWKILPEIAEKKVREELDRMLKGIDAP